MPNSTPDECLVAPRPAPDPRSADLKRRRFLFTLGVGGAGAVVTAAGALPGASAAQIATAAPADEDSAYRVTEHVRDYYRTAKI
jgi:nitrous oxide reductase